MKTKAEIKKTWVRMVRNYIMGYENMERATNKYSELVIFATENSLDFVVNLDGAVNHLDKNNCGQSFRHAIDRFRAG